MVNVECPGCGAPYSMSEKRIPDNGLKMRCPKCGESFMVNKPGGGPPAPPRRPPPVPTGPTGGPTGPTGGLAAGASRASRPLPRRPKATVQGHRPLGSGLAAGALRSNAPPPPTPSPSSAKGGIFSGGGSGGELGDDLSVDGLLQAAERADRRTAMGGGLPGLDGGFDDVDDGFGVLDMDLPGGDHVDADLPMPAIDADLPMPAGHADLPMPVHDHAGLPVAVGPPRGRAPHHGADLPMPVDADLPSIADAELPMVAHSDLPMPAAHADLPMPAGYGDLPMPAGYGDLPLPAGDADLPLPFAHGDLPLPGAGLPIPAGHDLPLPSSSGDLPIPSAAGDLPLPGDHNLPTPSAGGDLPLPGDFDFPDTMGASGDDAIPMEGYGHGLPPSDQRFLDEGGFPGAAGGGGYEYEADLEADLVSEPPRAYRPDEAMEPHPPRREGGAVGDEFAIDQIDDGAQQLQEGQLLEEGAPEGAGGVDAPKIKIKRKRSLGLRAALVTIPLLAIGGGLLTLTPLGPYGVYGISDALNAGDYAERVTAFRSEAQDQLAADTFAQAKALLERARAEQEQMPRYSPMRAYVAFIAFDMVLRFGDDSATLATGKQLMAILADNSSGELVDLARAASTAADGQATAAQAMMTALGGRLPGDIDAAVLAGEVALAAGAKDAEATWKAALDVQKSARTLFGMARAQRAADKVDEAEKTAREVLKLSKDHAGARTIVAAALWGRDRKDPEVLKLLEEVIKPGAVHDAASQNEVVLALALQGDVYLSQSKMTAAEKAFGEALKIDPKSERALIGNGELLYQAGRPSEALARFSRVAPDNIEGAIGKAKSMIALERAKEAKALLTPLAKSNKHPLVGYWLGQALLALGEREEAETAYRKAIEVGGSHPDVVQPYVALADLLDSRGEAAEAEKILAEASEKLPKSVALHIAKGDVALKAGRVDEAKKEFRAALAIVANNSLAEFRLGVAHRRAGEYAIAAQQFDKVGKDDPEFPGLALERGLLFQEQGKLDEALKMYADALEKAPDDIDLKMRVASTQVISGHPDQALPLLREVIKKRPQSGEANHFLGRALLVMGDNAGEALRFLQSAVQHDPNQAEYHLYVAWAANETGNLGLAQEEIDKALAINGDLGDAYWQKGVLLQKKGATRDALEELSIALEKNPTRFEAYAAMALCYQDQTQLNLAEDAWRKAVEGNKWVPEWQYRLGVLLFDRGAKDEAAPFLERAVDLMAERKQTAVWLWKANFLLGETLRNSDPKRALTAYEEFMRLAKSENAYWADAKAAVEQLKKRP